MLADDTGGISSATDSVRGSRKVGGNREVSALPGNGVEPVADAFDVAGADLSSLLLSIGREGDDYEDEQDSRDCYRNQ